ncbi:MAG: hypothetical protein V4735_07545 [Pseudomonadota bacterium]
MTTHFIGFALYLCVSALLLIVCPVMMHPTLPRHRKLIISAIAFFVVVPLGCGIYALIGAPEMAAA